MSKPEAIRLGVVSAVSDAATERRIVYSVASFLLFLQGIYRHSHTPFPSGYLTGDAAAGQMKDIRMSRKNQSIWNSIVQLREENTSYALCIAAAHK